MEICAASPNVEIEEESLFAFAVEQDACYQKSGKRKKQIYAVHSEMREPDNPYFNDTGRLNHGEVISITRMIATPRTPSSAGTRASKTVFPVSQSAFIAPFHIIRLPVGPNYRFVNLQQADRNV